MPTSAEFLAEVRREFPSFRVIAKRDSSFSKLIDVTLRVVTLGGQNEYMTRYHTVIAGTLYVPDRWDEEDDVEKVITLRHERIHLRQSRRYTFLGMAFLYVIPFFPLGLAYGRARIEWEAYTETIRATAELLGMKEAKSPWLRKHILKQFTSASYGWMWPFPEQLERWYDEALSRIDAEISSSSREVGTMSEAE